MLSELGKLLDNGGLFYRESKDIYLLRELIILTLFFICFLWLFIKAKQK